MYMWRPTTRQPHLVARTLMKPPSRANTETALIAVAVILLAVFLIVVSIKTCGSSVRSGDAAPKGDPTAYGAPAGKIPNQGDGLCAVNGNASTKFKWNGKETAWTNTELYCVPFSKMNKDTFSDDFMSGNGAFQVYGCGMDRSTGRVDYPTDGHAFPVAWTTDAANPTFGVIDPKTDTIFTKFSCTNEEPQAIVKPVTVRKPE